MTPLADENYERSVNFVAAAYEERGYVVHVDPGADLLPAGLTGTAVDLIAVRSDDKVIVEFTSRAVPERPDELFVTMARIAEAAGWRVEFALAAPYEPRLRTAETQVPVEKRAADLVARPDPKVQPALDQGDLHERIDATLRLLLREPSEDESSTLSLLKGAWSLGYVNDPQEYEALAAAIGSVEDHDDAPEAQTEAALQALAAAYQRWLSYPADFG